MSVKRRLKNGTAAAVTGLVLSAITVSVAVVIAAGASGVVIHALALRSGAAPVTRSLQPVDEGLYKRVLAAQKGKVVLVDFWATYCDPCREEMPHLVSLERRLRGRGLVLVTVSADEPEQKEQATQFVASQGIGGPAWIKQTENNENFINSVDPKWSGALPALFLYDRSGRLVRSFVGETPITDIENQILKVL